MYKNEEFRFPLLCLKCGSLERVKYYNYSFACCNCNTAYYTNNKITDQCLSYIYHDGFFQLSCCYDQLVQTYRIQLGFNLCPDIKIEKMVTCVELQRLRISNKEFYKHVLYLMCCELIEKIISLKLFPEESRNDK